MVTYGWPAAKEGSGAHSCCAPVSAPNLGLDAVPLSFQPSSAAQLLSWEEKCEGSLRTKENSASFCFLWTKHPSLSACELGKAFLRGAVKTSGTGQPGRVAHLRGAVKTPGTGWPGHVAQVGRKENLSPVQYQARLFWKQTKQQKEKGGHEPQVRT